MNKVHKMGMKDKIIVVMEYSGPEILIYNPIKTKFEENKHYVVICSNLY